MSLLTRCPNCHTVFQTQSSQLELRQGLVCCGLCQQVFNAHDHTATRVSPSFLKETTKKARRLWIMLGGLTLSISLLIALLVGGRNQLVEHFPRSVQFLYPMCRLFSCTLVPSWYIDAVEVVHSELRPGDKVNAYLLRLVLQNRADFVVRLPTLEISLINAQDEIVLQRTIPSSDYLTADQAGRMSNEGLVGNSMLPLEIKLQAPQSIMRYHLLVRYP